MKIFAASAGGLRPKDTRGHFFLPEEGGFGAFSVSSARGFLCGRSALKYKRENRNFLYQTFLFRFLGFCLFGGWHAAGSAQEVADAAVALGVDVGECKNRDEVAEKLLEAGWTYFEYYIFQEELSKGRVPTFG